MRKNIRLRMVEPSDIDVIHTWRMDEEVSYWGNGGRGDILWSRNELAERLLQEKGSNRGRTLMVDVEEEAGQWRPIGTVSYRNLDQLDGMATLGMMIGDRQYWGNGYGGAALDELLYLLFRRYNLRRVELDTHSDNKRAIRCYEKAGFVVEGVRRKARFTINGYRDAVFMGLLREEWEQRVGTAPKYI